MESKKISINKKNLIFCILIIGAVLVNIKSVFLDYSVDSGYAVAMGYRMVQGDKMIDQMWEPHQTSAFLCAILIKLYLLITNTTTGIVIYLHVMGVLIKGSVAYMIYRVLKPLVSRDSLFFMVLFFFSVTPKGLPMPEFSNMQVWFSVGLFCYLIRYLNEQAQKKWLFGAAICLCLEVLAYPTCIIVYGGILVLLYCYSEKKWKDIFLFSGVCAGIGCIYCIYFIGQMGMDSFWENLQYIVAGDSSHSKTLIEKFFGYAKEIFQMALDMFALAIIACILHRGGVWLYKIKNKEERKMIFKDWVIIFFCLLLTADFIKSITVSFTYDYRFPIYIPILVTGILLLKECTDQEKRICVAGITISCLSVLATLFLTNLSFAATLNYMILAIMVSIIPIVKKLKKVFPDTSYLFRYGLVILFCLTTLLHHGYIIKCFGGNKTNIFDVEGIVKSGPVMGILSEYMGPHRQNTAFEEWKQYVQEGDCVLIVGTSGYDPVKFLYEDVEIAIDSTICTPTYDEKLLKYWEKHPEKIPNVVLVECWSGEAKVKSDSWIMEWINKEFSDNHYIDGKYWRYYRKEEQ